MSETKALIRSNPNFTTNYKLTVAGSDIYLNSIDAEKSLANDKYKDFKTSKDSDLGNDLYTFWGKGKYPETFVYIHKQKTNDTNTILTPELQYEKDYYYGAERCISPKISEKFKIFAPLYISDRIPKKFVIFKVVGARDYTLEPNPELIVGVTYKIAGTSGKMYYNNKTYSIGQGFKVLANVDPPTFTGDAYYYLNDTNYENQLLNFKTLITNSEIIKVYDLVESNIGQYLAKIISDPLFTTSPIKVDFNELKITYTGFCLDSGVLSQKEDSFEPALEEIATISGFDEYVSNGFRRNKLASSNIINLEFCFDSDAGNTFDRYYGMYCDDVDLAQLQIDRRRMFYEFYPDNRITEDFIPFSIDKKISDESGIKIPYTKKLSGHLDPDDSFYSNPLSYYYVKFRENLFKLNKKEQNVLTLKENNINLTQIFGISDSVQHYSEDLPKGKSSLMFEVTSEFALFGEKIDIVQNGLVKGSVIGDYLPDYPHTYRPGDSVAIYFYPTGKLTLIAKAIAKAFNYIFDKQGVYKAYNIQQWVIIKCNYDGNTYDDLTLVFPQTPRVFCQNPKMCGGSATEKNRISIPYDVNDIDSTMYIAVDDGYSRVATISPYTDEQEVNRSGVVSFEKLFELKTLTSLAPNKKILLDSKKSFVVSEEPISFGVMSFYDIVDMDSDTESLEYRKSYYSEYKKYYSSEKLTTSKEAGFDLTITSKGGVGNIITIEYLHESTIMPLPFPPTILLCASVVRQPNESLDQFIDNIVAATNLSTSYAGLSAVRNGKTIRFTYTPDMFAGLPPLGALGNTNLKPLVTSTGFITKTFDAAFNGGQDPSLYKIYRSTSEVAVIKHDGFYYGVGGTYNAMPLTDNFLATSETFEIIKGSPIVIDTKYEQDEEIETFIGFNSLSSKNPLIQGLTIDKKYELLKPTEENEYSLLKENELPENALKNKLWRSFNKWVLEDSKDIRNNDYRLNVGLGFNAFGFSPSFIDKIPNPTYFSHEWFYISPPPFNISHNDLVQSDSYFEKYFDEDLYSDRINDYFKKYFTVDTIDGEQVALQKRYSKVYLDKEDNVYKTFFRGVKIELGSADIVDYNNYKFSVLLQFKPLTQDGNDLPISYKLIENKDFRNMVLLIDARFEDYKTTPFFDGKLFGEYSSLYMLNSVKRWSSNYLNPYYFGKVFRYPSIAGITFPSQTFEGVKIPIKADQNLNLDPATLEFDPTYFRIEEILKENNKNSNNDDFGTLFGYNILDKSSIFTTDNAALPSNYNYGTKNIQNVVGSDVKLNNNGLYVGVFTGFSYFGSTDPVPFYGIYDLGRLSWFQVNGGKDYYKDLITYVSFTKIKEVIEGKHPLVQFFSISEGTKVLSNINIDFIEPTKLVTRSFPTLDTSIYNFQATHNKTLRIPTLSISRITENQFDQQRRTLLHRYSGYYQPKFSPIVKFKSQKMTKFWSAYSITWNNASSYVWNDFLDDTIDYEEMIGQDNVNTMIDESASKTELSLYYHKWSTGAILKFSKAANVIDDGEQAASSRRSPNGIQEIDNPTQTPIFPEINEIAIAKGNINILKSNWDSGYYFKNVNANRVSKISGSASTFEEKSFFMTSLFNLPDEFIKTVENYEEAEIKGLGGTTIVQPVITSTFQEDRRRYIIKVNLKSIVREHFFDVVKTEMEKYIQSSDITNLANQYIENNFYRVYELINIDLYKKDNGGNLPTINTTVNALEILKLGYLKDRDVKSTLDNDILTLIIAKKKEFRQSFNIKLKFKYK